MRWSWTKPHLKGFVNSATIKLMEVSESELPEHVLKRHREIDEIMEVAVANAIEENRRLGLYSEETAQPTARVAEKSDSSE